MDAAMWFIQEESRKHESRCMSALQLVRSSRTMWEVKRAADVHAPSVLRGMHLHNQGAGRQLKNAAEQKMSDMLDAQLTEAKALPDLDARKKFLGKLRADEWNAMRGDYSQLYRRADMDAQRLVAKL
jgi:hypothetical protein